jgi:hypothetical protein
MTPESEPSSIYLDDGSLNAEALSTQYGLSPDFAMQHVTFGEYKGTVAEMLENPDPAGKSCPLRATVFETFQTKGIEGVTQYFTAMEQFMGADFQGYELSVDTSASEDVKKNRNQIFPLTP